MIAIIDYGLSNLLSIKRAVEVYSQNVIITNKQEDLKCATHIFLPGVGAYKYGMSQMNSLGLNEVLREEAGKGKPIMGICLGMQMLFEDSEEGGLNQGLGLIQGHVKKIPNNDVGGSVQNVPHIGWKRLIKHVERSYYPDLLSGVKTSDEFYFVHSYEGKTEFQENNIASVNYGGREICAIVQKDKTVGCQFHPEKSGSIGLRLIENFLKNF